MLVGGVEGKFFILKSFVNVKSWSCAKLKCISMTSDSNNGSREEVAAIKLKKEYERQCLITIVSESYLHALEQVGSEE